MATSCWVNWSVFIGLIGSWFFSWVVSSFRKVCWSPARDCWAPAMFEDVLDEAPVLGVVEFVVEFGNRLEIGWVTDVVGAVVMTSPQIRMSRPSDGEAVTWLAGTGATCGSDRVVEA